MVKAGDIVKVKVMDVDIPRKRIALSMRLDEQPGDTNSAPRRHNDQQERNSRKPQSAQRDMSRKNQAATGNSAMSDALAAAFGKKR